MTKRKIPTFSFCPLQMLLNLQGMASTKLQTAYPEQLMISQRDPTILKTPKLANLS
jgi:hypothetical protein